MSIHTKQPKLLNLFNPTDIYLKQTEALTEKQLQKYDLSEEQIGKQTIEELEKSLAKIDTYIDKPGVLIPKISSHPLIRPRVSHLLEQRKKLISERLEALKAELTIGNLRDLIYKVQNGDLKSKLINEWDELKNQCTDLQKQVHESQKSVVRWDLARDTASTIILGILGLIVVSAYVVGMFLKIQIPDVFSDFIVASLGYLTASLSTKSSKDSSQESYLNK